MSSGHTMGPVKNTDLIPSPAPLGHFLYVLRVHMHYTCSSTLDGPSAMLMLGANMAEYSPSLLFLERSFEPAELF